MHRGSRGSCHLQERETALLQNGIALRSFCSSVGIQARQTRQSLFRLSSFSRQAKNISPLWPPCLDDPERSRGGVGGEQPFFNVELSLPCWGEIPPYPMWRPAPRGGTPRSSGISSCQPSANPKNNYLYFISYVRSVMEQLAGPAGNGDCRPCGHRRSFCSSRGKESSLFLKPNGLHRHWLRKPVVICMSVIIGVNRGCFCPRSTGFGRASE
jgi:hypothetical protein